MTYFHIHRGFCLLAILLFVLSGHQGWGQCSELFISEYVEGWSNNKAFEVYNPTEAPIDMSDYQLERYSNGATAAQDNQKITLMGTVMPGDVLVYVLDKQDPDGVDFEAPVWPELAAAADHWLCPVYEVNNTMYYNGNDALVLRKISTNTPIDIFGVIGEDPGTAGWDEVTQNQTLVRHPDETGGDINAVDDFNVLAVWDSLGVNVFDHLGYHICDCTDLPTAIYGCTVASACNYSPVATTDDGSCVYPAEPWLDCNGQCLQDLDGNGVCDDLEGSILFQEDFANGFAGNNGVGPLVAEDTSPSTTIWQWVDPNGDGYHPDGSASGVQPPAGEFSTNIGALESATADNGWVIFDGDYYNTPISSGVEDVEGTLSLPTLDFSGVTSVVIEWDQYFRYCCYPLAPFFLEVSSDGGATWTSFEAKGEFLESANAASANPLHTTVDIGCAAAGEPAVAIRFAWRQHPDYGSGYSHYYWGLDDIVIRENPVSIGMEIAHVFTGDVVNDFAYSLVPLSQVVSTGDGGLLAQVHHRNTGNIDLPGAVVDIDILDSIGQVVHSTQTAPFTSVAQANGATCPAEDTALLDIPTGWVPDGVGEYTVRATLTAPEYPNAVPVEQSIRFTDCLFGHDDAAALDEVLTPVVHDDIPDLFDPTGYGSRFTFEEAGQHVYGIEVAFGPELGHGLEFEIRWIEQDPTTSLTDSPYEFAEFVTDSAWGSSPEAPEFTALYFEQPISVNASSFYAAAVITEFEWEESLEVLANADSDFDESTIVYLQSGSGEFVWFAGQSSTPAIRLITCVPEPIEGCTDPEATNYDPFATLDDGTCTYPVSGCTDPEAVNYDPVAVIDDGSCVFDLGCPDIGSGAFDGQPLDLYPAQSMGMAGIPMDASVALHVPSSIVEDGTGTVYAVHSFVPSGYGGDDVPGITLPTLPGTMEGNQQACLDLVGTPMSAGLFEVEVVGDLYISVFGSPFLAGEFTLLHTVVIEPNPNPIEGCMYVGATNYSPLATVDVGGCIIPGCMDAAAVNYHPVFTLDDGTCVFADDLGGSQCPSDLNGDDLVGVGDLLILLGEFGVPCTP